MDMRTLKIFYYANYEYHILGMQFQSIDCVRRLKKSNENNEKYEIHDFILECSQDYEYFANIRII